MGVESQKTSIAPELERDGYRAEREGDYVLVWHHKNQIALLAYKPGIESRVEEMARARQKQLAEITASNPAAKGGEKKA